MLNRQRCILYMIEQAGRPVSRLELVQWAFLLAEEMPSGGGPSFYDFLPYQFGPFSFALSREANKLARDGYTRESRTSDRNAWELVADVRGDTCRLSRNVRSDAARVVQRFVNLSGNDLIDYVYGRFPWYTVNSKIRQLQQRCVADLAVYTVGYEGLSVDRLLNILMRTGIQRIIDVRRNPVARRYGFHRSSLSDLCGRLDIDYVHVPEVGIPSELRRNLDSPQAYTRLFDRYERLLLPRETDAVARIAQLTTGKPTALMCMEADPLMCHRTRVANTVSAMTHLPVRHLQGKTCDPVSN